MRFAQFPASKKQLKALPAHNYPQPKGWIHPTLPPPAPFPLHSTDSRKPTIYGPRRPQQPFSPSSSPPPKYVSRRPSPRPPSPLPPHFIVPPPYLPHCPPQNHPTTRPQLPPTTTLLTLPLSVPSPPNPPPIPPQNKKALAHRSRLEKLLKKNKQPFQSKLCLP